MSTGIRICILTSSHSPFDGRIFHRHAKCLAKAGYDTTIIVPHTADEVVDGVRIKAVPKSTSRFKRLLITPFYVFKAAIREEADIYHFHDPELILFGLLLKLLGKRVVYDVHEYYKLNYMTRRPSSSFLRYLFAYIFDFLETRVSRLYDGVVAVDRMIESKFKGMAVTVSNYPYRPGNSVRINARVGEFKCVYAGGLNADRGLFKMIEAMEHVDRPARLILLGSISDEYRRKSEKMKGYEKVEILGHRSWEEVQERLQECDLGLVLLQPVPAYFYAGEGTVKLFEYMGAALPVLGSNFPNLERIINEAGCGTTVDPTDPVEIARKIIAFAEDPINAKRMGENGRRAVMEKYNWETESKNLLGLYNRILADQSKSTHMALKGGPHEV